MLTGYATPDRHGKKVLAIGPGFGFLKHPEQIKTVETAGYQVGEAHANICPVGWLSLLGANQIAVDGRLRRWCNQ